MEQEEVKNWMQKMEEAYRQERNKNLQLSQAVSTSTRDNSSDNIIRFRLEMEKEKNKLEHFYSGDIKIFDEKLGEVWVENPDIEERTFNKRGVRLLMEQFEIFNTKGTMLSSYDIDRINKILEDFGNALADFIVVNWFDLGMDTEYKQSKLPLVILSTVFSIESAFRRAVGGTESTASAPNVSIHQVDSPQFNNPFSDQNRNKFKWI